MYYVLILISEMSPDYVLRFTPNVLRFTRNILRQENIFAQENVSGQEDRSGFIPAFKQSV